MRIGIADEATVGHMLEAIDHIEQFMNGRTRDSLDDDIMFRSAIERKLEILGEAVVHITQEVKDECNHIAWADIKRFSNVVAHEYFGINQNTVGIFYCKRFHH